MSDLNTKTLNELDTITELGENDKILVESSGRMKKIAGNVGGGGIELIEQIELEDPHYGTINGLKITPRELINMLESGKMPMLYITDSYSDGGQNSYIPFSQFYDSYSSDGNGGYTHYYNIDMSHGSYVNYIASDPDEYFKPYID